MQHAAATWRPDLVCGLAVLGQHIITSAATVLQLRCFASLLFGPVAHLRDCHTQCGLQIVTQCERERAAS